MNVLQCFHFEDNAGEAARVKAAIETAWELVLQGKALDGIADAPPTLHISPSSDPVAAVEELKRNGGAYDLLVVDLLVKTGRTQAPDGLRIVEALRASGGSAAVLAISRSEQTSFVGLRQTFEAAARLPAPGAHNTYGTGFIAKAQLFTSSRPMLLVEVAQLIAKILVDAGVLHQPTSEAVATKRSREFSLQLVPLGHKPLEAIVYSIGQRTCEDLAADLLGPGYLSGALEYLTPGMSGANVLKLTGKGPGLRERTLLMKISAQRSALERETRKYPMLGDDMGRLFARYQQVPPAERAGWYAISADFQTNATTLLKWITDPHNTREPAQMLQELFLRGLDVAYRKSTVPGTRPTIEELFPREDRAARIWVALEELDELATECAALCHVNWDAGLIRRYLERDLFEELKPVNTPPFPVICNCHGDLHCRNILVDQAGFSYRLIDPADVGDMHWARDIARFLIDLVAAAVDRGPTAYKWDQFQTWLGIATSVTLNAPLAICADASQANKRVLSAIQWCQNEFPRMWQDRLPPPSLRWELMLAEAVEWLRSAYRPDLPAPKRVLGLVAGHAALEAASAAYRQL